MSFGAEILIRLLLGGLSATLLGAVVWLLVRLVRPRPAVGSLLWLCVVVKFALPITPFAVPLTPPRAMIEASPPDVSASLAAAGEAGRSTAAERRSTGWVTGGGVPDAARAVDLVRGGAGPIAGVLLAVWLAGTVAVFSRHVRHWRRWRRRHEGLQGAPSWLCEEVERVAARMGIRAPDVRLYPAATPAVIGLRRPVLLWPTRLAAEPVPGVPSVVAHELAHVRRRDVALGVLEIWVESVWWWYPPARRVIGRLRSTVEEACDAVAVSLFPAARRAYAEALLRSLGSVASPRPAAGLALAPVHRTTLRRRLERIVHDRRASDAGRRGRAGAIAFILLVVPFSLDVVAAARPASSPPLAGVISRGRVDATSARSPAVAPDAWLIAFSFGETERMLQMVGGPDDTAVDYRIDGRPASLDADAIEWLEWLIRETGWAPGPADGRLSASGAVTPGGPHVHRTDPQRTLALWAPVRRPFDAAGTPVGIPAGGPPIVVVEQASREDAVRVYRVRGDGTAGPSVAVWEDARAVAHGPTDLGTLTMLGRRIARELASARDPS